ncbi:MAG TPA: Clp protease N-terminal domain-containing protein, partial [Alphaproteobacteria bacterium]
MDFEKFTERSRGFVQAAQARAASLKHQELASEHLLKVLLEDEEGLCANLMRRAGADPEAAGRAVDAALARRPRVEGS